MTSLVKLKQVRHAHRMVLKRIETNIDDAIEEDSDELTKLKGLESTLMCKIKCIQKLDEEILGKIDDEEEIVKEVEDASEYEEIMFGIVAKVESTIKPLPSRSKKKPELTTTTSSPTSTPTENSPGVKETKVKLPKLEIGQFDGNPINWRGFWDQFKTSIHDEPNLSEINKFTYLKSYLCQEAADCINGLSLTDGNYRKATEILEERFGNTQILISSYMKVLAQLPKVASLRDLVGLRNVYDKIQVSVRNLTDLGVATDTYGSLLINILFDRMPAKVAPLKSLSIDKIELLGCTLLAELVECEKGV